MVKAFWASVVVALGVAGCASAPRLGPPVWTADYGVPFDGVVKCLATSPAGSFSVGAPTPGLGGVVRIDFIPANVPQANSFYMIQHLPNDGARVNWYRAN